MNPISLANLAVEELIKLRVLDENSAKNPEIVRSISERISKKFGSHVVSCPSCGEIHLESDARALGESFEDVKAINGWLHMPCKACRDPFLTTLENTTLFKTSPAI